MTKKLRKVEEEKESDKQLTEVELLKQLVSQNEQIIQLLTKLKERFV